MTIRKTFQGAYEISATVNGYLVTRQYFFHTKKEAISQFKKGVSRMDNPQFDGKTYQRELDFTRLKSQLEKVKHLMLDGHWRTLSEIEHHAGGTIASVSARLRDLRKAKFGGYKIERTRLKDGLFIYRMIP